MIFFSLHEKLTVRYNLVMRAEHHTMYLDFFKVNQIKQIENIRLFFKLRCT